MRLKVTNKKIGALNNLANTIFNMDKKTEKKKFQEFGGFVGLCLRDGERVEFLTNDGSKDQDTS